MYAPACLGARGNACWEPAALPHQGKGQSACGGPSSHVTGQHGTRIGLRATETAQDRRTGHDSHPRQSDGMQSPVGPLWASAPCHALLSAWPRAASSLGAGMAGRVIGCACVRHLSLLFFSCPSADREQRLVSVSRGTRRRAEEWSGTRDREATGQRTGHWTDAPTWDALGWTPTALQTESHL